SAACVTLHCYLPYSTSTLRRSHWCSTLFPYTTLFRSRGLCHFSRLSGRRSQRDPVKVGTGQELFLHRQRSLPVPGGEEAKLPLRSEEHTSELQSRFELVCRLLLE